MGLSITRVRMMIRDSSADQNYLLDDVEFSDDEIEAAMDEAVSEWNETTPVIPGRNSYTASSFPWTHHFRKGVTAYLLRIAAANYERNHLSYSAGGVTVNDKNKIGAYEQLADRLLAEWRTWMRNKKRQLNADTFWTTMVVR